MLPHRILPVRSDSAGRHSPVAPTAARPGLPVGLGWHQGTAPGLTAGPAAPERRGGAVHLRRHLTQYARTLSRSVEPAGVLVTMALILFTVLTELPLQWVAALLGGQ